MSRPMRPIIGLSGRPLPVSFVHVLAAVGRLPQAAARAAAVEAPRRAPALVRRGVEHVRVRRVHHDIGEAGVVVDEVRVRPGLAAVGRLEQAALGVRPEQVAERGDVDDVRILRVDDDAADALGFLQPDVLERLAGVGRLVDAGAERRALAVVRLAGADVDDVGVGRRDRDVADRRDRVLVEDRRPGRAVVGRLPDAAGREADVDDRRVALDDRDVVDAAAHVGRADRAPDEGLEDRIVRGIDRRGQRRCRLRESLPPERACRLRGCLRQQPAAADCAQTDAHEPRRQTQPAEILESRDAP